MQEKNTPNWALLSAARFVLAMIVLMGHFDDMGLSSGWFVVLCDTASVPAVFGFLAISGYSIKHSIEQRREGFLFRRFRRIYPCYAFALLLAIAVVVLGGTMVTTPSGETGAVTLPDAMSLFSHVVMLQSITTKTIYTFIPSWSLSVECVFYLLAPLLIFLDSKKIGYLLLVSAAFFLFAVVDSGSGWNPRIGLYSVIELLCFWLMGWQIQQGDLSNVDKGLFIVLCFVLLQSPVALIPASIVLLVLYQDRVALPMRGFKETANYLGELSYPIYILHYPVYWLVWQITKSTSLLLYIGAALLMSAAVYQWIDKPLRGRKNKAARQPETLSAPALPEYS